jgi:hypothetical protein
MSLCALGDKERTLIESRRVASQIPYLLRDGARWKSLTRRATKLSNVFRHDYDTAARDAGLAIIFINV